MSLHGLLWRVFRISFIAMRFEEGVGCERRDFHCWVRARRRLDRRLNHAVFTFLAGSDFASRRFTDDAHVQFTLDAVSDLIAQHYRRRLWLYRQCRRLPFNLGRTFMLGSMLYAYRDQIAQFLQGVGHLARRYRIGPQRLPLTIDLAVGFPRHSFATPATGDRNGHTSDDVPAFSFGEFLENFCRASPDPAMLVSLDEYVRMSKAKEEPRELGSVSRSRVAEYPRVKATLSRGLPVLLARLPRLALQLCALLWGSVCAPGSTLLELEYCRKWARSYRYFELLGWIRKAVGPPRRVFVPPFSDVGLLSYDRTMRAKITTFSYSHNVFSPPSSLQGDERALSQMDVGVVLASAPFGAFRLSGRAVGYTEIFGKVNRIRSAVNEAYGCRLPLEGAPQPAQRPVFLGYEPAEDESLPWHVAVFDVPPESRATQLSRALLGDRTCDDEVVAEFLEECLDACQSQGFGVVFKPKYSLSNYSARYRAMLEGFRRQFGERLVLTSPYRRMAPLLASVRGSISMPYTSTKLIARAVGKPSVYFMPEKYRASFPKSAGSADCIFGKNELTAFLGALAERRDSFGSTP